MTTYHRYIVADAKSITLDELCAAVRVSNSRIDFNKEVVLCDGAECGIMIDVTQRGDPIFDDDLVVLRDRLGSSGAIDSHTWLVLDAAQCMVTVQVTSNTEESALDAIWSTLRSYRPGILVMEGCASAIRYDE